MSSVCGGAGDDVGDLRGGGDCKDSLPFGELDREGRSEDIEDSRVEGAELEFWFTELEIDVDSDSTLSGSLVFGTTRVAPGEKDGGGLTGAASSGDVMGSSDVLVI
jgi:hypothetical protein